MQGTGWPETSNPVGFAGLGYTWIDSNKDGIPQQSEWMVPSQQVFAFGGSRTHIDSNMSRPYSEQISAAYEKRLWRDLRGRCLHTTIEPRTPESELRILLCLLRTTLRSRCCPTRTMSRNRSKNGLTGQPLTLYNLNPAKQTNFNFVVTNIPKAGRQRLPWRWNSPR